jgi:hypothetical protein
MAIFYAFRDNDISPFFDNVQYSLGVRINREIGLPSPLHDSCSSINHFLSARWLSLYFTSYQGQDKSSTRKTHELYIQYVWAHRSISNVSVTVTSVLQ